MHSAAACSRSCCSTTVRSLFLAGVLMHPAAHAADDSPAVDFDRWGILVADLTWNSSERLDSWMADEDWGSFAGYYTEDLRSGYGGALGRYEWGEAEWRFGGLTEDGVRASQIPWRSDRFGVYDGNLRWRTPAIGFDRWVGRATFDWAGSRAPDSQGLFPF